MNSYKTSNAARPRLRVYWGDILYDTRLLAPSSDLKIGESEENDFVIDTGHQKSKWRLAAYRRGKLELKLFDDQDGFFRRHGETLPLRKIERPNGILEVAPTEATELAFGDCTFAFDWVDSPEVIAKSRPIERKTMAGFVAITSLLLFIAFVIPKLPPTEMPRTVRSVKLIKEIPKPIPVPVPKPEPIVPTPVEAPQLAAPKIEPAKTEKIKPALPKRSKVVAEVSKAAPLPADPFAKKEDEWANLSGTLNQLTENRAVVKKGRTPNEVTPLTELPSSRGLANTATEERLSQTTGQGEGTVSQGEKLVSSAPDGRKRGLDRSVIENYVHDRDRQLSECFQSNLSAQENRSGYLKVRFTILGSGKIAAPKIVDDTVRTPAVTQCVLREMQGWQFPPSPDGKSTTVEFPFTFEKR